MAERTPVVSIVMAARNAQATIVQAIDSLRTQTCEDWELIVIDDGSTDATAAIVADFVARDPRIHSFPGPESGVSAARNLGIAASGGQWLGFLDSDDWFEPQFLEAMLAALTTNRDARAAYCAYRRVMPDGSMTDARIDSRVADAPFEAFARTCAVVTIHCLLLDRALVADAGGFDADLRTCEDWDLWQRLSRAGMRWIMVNRPLAFYRASEGSLTRLSRQMLHDGRIVIDRAWQPDPRVPAPLPLYARGLTPDAPGQSADEAYAWFALWCMVVGRLSGDNAPFDSRTLASLPRGPDWAFGIADTVIQALTVGRRAVPAELALFWTDCASVVCEAAQAIANGWDQPDAARRLIYAVEFMLLYERMECPATITLDFSMRIHIPIGHPDTTPVPDGVDRVLAIFTDQGEVVGSLMVGVLGDVGARQWASLMRDQVSLGRVVRAARRDRPVATANALVRALASRARRPSSLKSLASRRGARALAGDALVRLAKSGLFNGHERALRDLKAKAKAAADGLDAVPAPPRRLSAPPEESRGGDRQQFWDRYFQSEDPWNYGSLYEQEKYDRQIMALPKGHIGKALELACAEGFFTRKLAPHVERLIATDISATAVERARARNIEHTNIDWRMLDLSADPLPADMDLIVCSEVLYYLSDADELARVVDRLIAALAPGGSILTAHAFVLADDRNRTGFDWANPFGAQKIADTFGAADDMVLETTIQTPLYRIDRFRKAASAQAPVLTELTVNTEIEDSVARAIVWDGAAALRSEVAVGETTDRLPILMYHGVSNEGPKGLSRWRLTPEQFRDQLRWLRSNGYHGLTGDQVAWYLRTRTPFAGRPVWITFDDGYRNFADSAWPLLSAHDFPAEMFIVTGHLGGEAIWDRALGQPTPLMDASTIAALAAEGVRFGSHLVTHRAADLMSTHDLAAELLASHAVIERLTGHTPAAFAAPFMAPDVRLDLLARQCGYDLGFGARSGTATLADSPRDLPRIEVRGDWSLADFAATMEATRA